MFRLLNPDSNTYSEIIVESYLCSNTSGKHGPIHIRPLPGQDPFLVTMDVACSKILSHGYPLGTKFKIKAKITRKEGGTPYIYSNYNWTYTVLQG